ncbi:hypothetical protein Q5752_007056 [Cryptotrichosporon argae]
MAEYEALPTVDPASTYPPSSPPRARRRGVLFLSAAPAAVLKYAAGGSLFLFLVHYALLGLFPASSYADTYHATVSTYFPSSSPPYPSYTTPHAAAVLDSVGLDGQRQPGTFFRDPRPLRTALAFWELAEREVAARRLDTCGGKLGRELVDAYARHEVAYCVPPGVDAGARGFTPVEHNGSHAIPWDPAVPVDGTEIYCAPVHRDAFSRWWPYPAAPCVSKNLRAVQDDGRRFHAVCAVTDDGARLGTEMGRERFLGSDSDRIGTDDDAAQCKERVERTLLVIGRQDQWNPFHVAEDLITTLVTMFIAARTAPQLVDDRVQLVFAEGYGMDANHFTPLWDRVGAWAPRRLSLDPWGENVCLTNTIHSVGAGASLLSAMGVGKSDKCTSTITWAAAHYYRHLFGLLPPALAPTLDMRGALDALALSDETHAHLRALTADGMVKAPSVAAAAADSAKAPAAVKTKARASANARKPRPKPINVLWLSRAKLDAYAQKHNDWSAWRDVRHIRNEPALIDRLRDGLAGMCSAPGDEGGDGLEGGCVFEDAQDWPESWAGADDYEVDAGSDPSSSSSNDDDSDHDHDDVNDDDVAPAVRRVRFATLDPTVHALETQIHYVGHASLLVSPHGGALGLALFLPPGAGALLELQVAGVRGNFHFEHMAAQMGHAYEALEIGRDVDVERVWASVERHVREMARAG